MTRPVGEDATEAAPNATSSSAEDDGGEAIGRGTTIGRYVVLSKLGAGGMGVVYVAYDPELDRKLALKLLRGEVAGTGSEGAIRLLREAQALGRLSHPNVVSVHDVGTRGEHVWLAMEFVAGRTLGEWLEERARGWREVLEVIRPVFLGLAAAHEAGLIHRDVKPDNVMLGDDGRVRVMDFGLARGSDAQPRTQDHEHGEADIAEERLRGRLDDTVTRLGATPGTPAYMSPEQVSGAVTDARTDQFSLCVMVWEALHGERPFAGKSLVELATNIVEGRRRPPVRVVRLPRWLRSVVDRGLSVSPEERWPSLPAMLDALDRGRVRARVLRAVVGAGTVAGVAAGVFGYTRLQERQRVAGCETEGAAIDTVWNDSERERVRAAILATGVEHAEETAEKVLPWLDRQADSWKRTRTEACLDSAGRHRFDLSTSERAAWCLEERLLEFSALAKRLEAADATTARNAVRAAAGLRRVAPCGDASLLSRHQLPSNEQRAAVKSLRSELATIRALEASGAYQEGLEAARESLETARALDWPPVASAARVLMGKLLQRTGAYAEAEAELEAAYFIGAKAGALEEALVASQLLIQVVGHTLHRGADGERWYRHSEVVRRQLPDVAGLREATGFAHLALIRARSGSYHEAIALLERALAMREDALGTDHPLVAATLHNLGGVQRALKEYDEALALLEKARTVMHSAFGPDHPETVATLDAIAAVKSEMGAYDEALELYERVRSQRVELLGPRHPDVADTLRSIAVTYFAMGELDRADELLERVLSIQEAALGKDHPTVADLVGTVGVVRFEQGAYDAAQELQERALALRERALGPDHIDVTMDLTNLANVHTMLGRYDDATALLERSVAIRRRVLGADDPSMASDINNLGNVNRLRGAYAEAAERYEEAISIWDKSGHAKDPSYASYLSNLANVRRLLGDVEGAKELWERAAELQRKLLGPNHRTLGRTQLGLARIALAQDSPGDAQRFAEDAVRIRVAADVPPEELAEARFVLARSLWGRDSRARAIDLATQARDALIGEGERHAEALTEVQSWLRAHAPRVPAMQASGRR